MPLADLSDEVLKHTFAVNVFGAIHCAREAVRRMAGSAGGEGGVDTHTTAGNPDRPAMVARTAPLGRVAEPEDIGEAILWLASEKAGFATDANLSISGGM